MIFHIDTITICIRPTDIGIGNSTLISRHKYFKGDMSETIVFVGPIQDVAVPLACRNWLIVMGT